ncbi:MAG TPA: class I SAM-dependent methyltransferase [Caulobacteraceae bacterium]|jgi:ubiquinone/menaquinone biosynthesis C-methylase UbiE
MALKTVDYDERQHEVYAAGRAMPGATLAIWLRLFAEQLPAKRPLTIVDLGSGTGRLTPALAEAFGGPVHGVEPSRKMRQIAEASGPHPGVDYRAGDAANIPLGDDVADAVLMFLSFHHVPNRAAAAAEIARVLKPGGRLLIHSGFADRLAAQSVWWHRFFPRALAIELEMYPTTAAVTELFAPVGLRPLALVEAPAQIWLNVADAVERLRLRSISTFEHLGADEIAEGFARLDAAIAAGTLPESATGVRDLLVLG